jgi:hypothetical protein
MNCEKCNIDGPTICNSGRISFKSILDHARHLEWRWPGPLNIGALHSQYRHNRKRYGETNFRTSPSPSFWPRNIATDVFRAGVAARTTRLDGAVRIKMEIVQNARLVNFHLKFPSEQNGIRKKFEARQISGKGSRRAVFFRKSAALKEKNALNNEEIDRGWFASWTFSSPAARHAIPPTIIIDILQGIPNERQQRDRDHDVQHKTGSGQDGE